MNAHEFLIAVSDLVYLFVFVSAAVDAIRTRRRRSIDTALLFGSFMAVIVLGLPAVAVRLGPPAARADVLLLLALPYFMLRLASGFAGVPSLAARIAAATAIPLALWALIAPFPLQAPVAGSVVLFFVSFSAWAASRFARAARRSAGSNRVRMRAIALGIAALTLAILVAGARDYGPGPAAFWSALSGVVVAISAASCYIGFAPPAMLRRLWREPAIRHFLEVAATTPASIPLPTVVEALSPSVAAAVGAEHAGILVWDPARDRLLLPVEEDAAMDPYQTDDTPGVQVFRTGRARYVEDIREADPLNEDDYSRRGVSGLLLAPAVTSDGPLGVVYAYSRRPAAFVEDDLALLEAVGHVIGAFLERHRLVKEAVETKALAETTQLKDDFLAAAAHDLRTPLTSILGQAQLMKRRLARGDVPMADASGLDTILDQAQRMRRMADDLLDASRADGMRFVGNRVPTDLLVLAREVATNVPPQTAAITVQGLSAWAEIDVARMTQVLENVLGNAVKFGDPTGEIEVSVTPRADGIAEVCVTNDGPGITPDEMPVIFERFRRGSGATARGIAGTGVGLFLARRIVEEHEGQIWAESVPHERTTFHVAIPALT